MLRDLNVEVTGREADLEGEAACALVVRPGVSASLDDVTVRGDVIGLDREEGVWRHPRTLSLGTLKAGTAHEFARDAVDPDPLRRGVRHRRAARPAARDPGRAGQDGAAPGLRWPPGTRLRGRLTLRSAYLTRRITVNALAAEGATNVGGGQVVWAPEGVAEASPIPRRSRRRRRSSPAPAGPACRCRWSRSRSGRRSPPTSPSSTPFSPLTTPLSAPVGGGAIVVSPDEGGHFRTIGEAIREARPGTKILRAARRLRREPGAGPPRRDRRRRVRRRTSSSRATTATACGCRPTWPASAA